MDTLALVFIDSSIRLIRRSGQVVPWNSSKIEVAIRKALPPSGFRTGSQSI